MGEAQRHIAEKPLTRHGERHRPVRPPEQGRAELVLQIADRVGHRRLAHPQLTPGQREGAMTSGGLEDDEAGGGGQEAAQGLHKVSLCKVRKFSSVTLEYFWIVSV